MFPYVEVTSAASLTLRDRVAAVLALLNHYMDSTFRTGLLILAFLEMPSNPPSLCP